ncbi:hypothetical protein B0T13DRAFT_486016 [Neurospora crassa]|nr:hypothetical protein B0T13DRAFT_486016 [Neurospora crassa]
MVCLTLAALEILAAIEFQTYGEVDPFLTSSSPVYRENYKQRDISTSFLTTPLKIDYTDTFVDQQDCKTYSQLIVTDIKNQYIIGTQITYDNTGSAGLKAKVIDVVISRSSTEPQAKQDSRDVLKTVANSYLDLWSSNGSFELPWGTPCARLEESVYYTEECQPVSLNGKTDTDKRYVIDEGLEAVSVFSKGGTDGALLDIHDSRLVQGKPRYIHHFTASDAASVV